MPGNEVGDRVHNFFAQDNLSQGQHLQVVEGNWPLNNNLWVGHQKQIGFLNSNPKNYNSPQSETERGHSSQNNHVPHGFNFTQSNARSEFGKSESQTEQPNLNGYMYGHQVLQTRPDEANFLGVNTESDRNNVNRRGFSVYDSRQEGVNEQISKNSFRMETSETHGSFDLFGGQHQTNSQNPGLLQPLPQQQSGFSDIQQLQQQLMFRKMKELQTQKDLRQLDARQPNLINQVSSFARQASGSHSQGLINGTPTSDSSGYPWTEHTTANTNWLQRASPAMQGSSSGLAFSPEQGQVQQSMGFVHQQIDQSLYGVPVSSSRGPLNQYPHVSTEKASIQHMPTYNNSLAGSQYAVIPEQVTMQDASRQGLSGKSLFGHSSGQTPNNGMNMEHIEQLKTIQQNVSLQEFQRPQDLVGPSDILPDKTAVEATSSHDAASLDPDEEKILFGSDDNIWDAFGSSSNVGGGASNLLDSSEFPSGLPSIQSGSWSALMQSAVAETSSSGVGLQGEWTGLNFQNPELPLGSRRPSTYEDTGKQQTASRDINLPNASALNFGSVPLSDGTNMNNKHHRIMAFQQHGKKNSYEHDERPRTSSSGQTNQQSSGGTTWLNHGAQQKVDAGGSPLYQTTSHSLRGEMNVKSMSGHWISQQHRTSQPNNKESSWNAVEPVPAPADAALNINESDNSLQRSQSNDRKRVMHEEIGHSSSIWRVDSLPNSSVEQESMRTSMGSTQINREGYAVNSAAAIPNSSIMHRGDHSGQFPLTSHHLNYWKHVDSSVKSRGNENSGKRHPNRGPQVSESSFNSSDKEDTKMHEMESSSKRENSNDSYRSSSSHLAATVGLRENVSSDAGDSRSLPGTKQSLSNQVGRKTTGPRKFQYHPMGNLDEDVEMPYGTRQATNIPAMSLHHSLGLRGQDQGYFGPSKISGQVPKNPAEVGKGHAPDLEGVAKGSDDMRFKGMIPGYVPNVFAPFDRSVGLSTSHKASQPSQNMLELLHKVDQSRDRGSGRNFGSFERNLSSEMPEGENSDGSVGGLQRSQSSNSQGFGLQLGPPSQRLSLPNHASPSAVGGINSNPSSQAQASPDIREKGHSELSHVPPSHETSHGEHKNDRTGISRQTINEASVHKTTNFSSALGTGFPYPRSKLQNQTVGARGHGLINHPGKESFERHSQSRQTDETGSRPLVQSSENDLQNAASPGPYDNAISGHERVQFSQTSAGEKLPATLSRMNVGMSQHGEFSKMLPNVWTNVPSQQHPLANQAGKGHSSLPQPHQLNIVESTSVGLQKLEDQEAEKREKILSKFSAGSLNSQGFASENSTRDSPSPNVSSGKADRAQMMNGPLVKESVIKPPSDASSVNPTATQRDFEAFGRSLKPNNFHQNYSLLNQMRAMKNSENDPSNRGLKRLKGSENYLGGQQVAPMSGQPNEHNNLVGDASTCHTIVSPGDPQLLNFSGAADNAEQNVPSQPRNAPAKDLLAFCPNESQNHVSSNIMAPVKVEHSHISPQMAPSWFDQYGTFKNGQMLPRRVDSVKIVEQPFSLGKLSGSLETHNSKQQVNAAADTSQAGVIWPTPQPPATEQFPSPLPTNASVQNLVTWRPKKRKRATADLHSWLKEVSGGFRTPQGINSVAVEWSATANRLMEKVEDDGEVIEDTLPVSRPKRRLILTTQLMQQLLRPPPATILSADACSNYESVVYYMARLALGDACCLVSSVGSNSSVPRSGANTLSDKSKQCERADNHLSEVMEDLLSKAKKMENDFLRLDKRASVLDLRVECQDLEKFSLINRFARFHGRGQTDGAETSSSDAAANALKSLLHRYVTAAPLPKNLPDRVQCLSL